MEMTPSVFGKLLRKSYLAYPQTKITDEIILAWYLNLSQYSDSEVSEALNICGSTSTYPFSLAEVIKAIGLVSGRNTDPYVLLRHTAVDQFREFMKFLSYNSQADFFFSDLRTWYAVKNTLPTLQDWNTSRLTNDQLQKRFVENYLDAHIDAFDIPFIPGKRHGTGEEQIAFVGNYNDCLKVADEVYGYRHKNIPLDPSTPKLERKEPQYSGQKADPEEVKKKLQELFDLMGVPYAKRPASIRDRVRDQSERELAANYREEPEHSKDAS